MNKITNDSQSLKEQKEELARKLDKANRDNVLLMQIIQKNGGADGIATATAAISEANKPSHGKSGSMNSSQGKAPTAIVPQNKGMMPRLNKTTKKQK